MENKNKILNGVILQNLPNTMFKIELEDGREVMGIPSGKMRRGFNRLLPGVKVRIEFTPYDADRGRIVGKIK